MDQLSNIREEARKRYEEKLRKDKEDERVAHQKRQKEIKQEEDHRYIYGQFDECDQLLTKNDDLIVMLHLYYSIINPHFMKLLHDYDRMDELQDRVVKLVYFLNDKSATSQFSLPEIKEMHDVMQRIIQLSETDIPIEMMDTSNDEELSKQLTAQLNFYEEEKDEDEKEEKAIEILPAVSLASTRIGLRLPAMRAIAKANGMSCSGSKRELALRLSEKGLIQLI